MLAWPGFEEQQKMRCGKKCEASLPCEWNRRESFNEITETISTCPSPIPAPRRTDRNGFFDINKCETRCSRSEEKCWNKMKLIRWRAPHTPVQRKMSEQRHWKVGKFKVPLTSFATIGNEKRLTHTQIMLKDRRRRRKKLAETEVEGSAVAHASSTNKAKTIFKCVLTMVPWTMRTSTVEIWHTETKANEAKSWTSATMNFHTIPQWTPKEKSWEGDGTGDRGKESKDRVVDGDRWVVCSEKP